MLWSCVRVVAATMLIGTWSAASPATANRWTQPEVLLDRGNRVLDPNVLAGPRRYAVTVWTSGTLRAVPASDDLRATTREENRVFASVREPGARRFGRPTPLSPRGAVGTGLAMNENGETVVAWINSKERVQVAMRTPDEDWSAPQTVSGSGIDSASIAVAREGTAVVAWRDAPTGEEAMVHVAVRRPDGSFGSPQSTPAPGIGNYGPIAAASPQGALVAWSGECPLFDPEAQKSTTALPVDLDGRLGAPEEIPNSTCPDAGIALEMDDQGGAVLMVNGSLEGGGVRAALRPPGGPFAPAALISREHETEIADFAELGIDASGRAVAVWPVFEDGEAIGRQAALREPGGGFEPPRGVRGSGAIQAPLAMSPAGHALTLWYHFPSARLAASYLSPGGWFGRRELVTPRLPRHAVTIPSAAVSPEGEALAAFSRPPPLGVGDGASRGVFVSKRAPNCRGVEATMLGTPGADVLRGVSGRRDVILARAGNDRINGRGGRNVICGGAGDDAIRSGRGDNRIYAGIGDDWVRVGAGDNLIIPGPGDDRILARAPGRNTIRARRGTNRIHCGAGRDLVVTNHLSQVNHRCDRVIRRSESAESP